MFGGDAGFRAAASAAALALSLGMTPAGAASSDYELLSQAVALITSKGLDSGTADEVYGRALDALWGTLSKEERALSPERLRVAGKKATKFEFIRAIGEMSRRTGKPPHYWIEGSLRAYLRSRDPHSDFLTPEEFRVYKGGKDRNFIGVGMEIERDEEGGFICMPFPGMAADRAGVKWGAALLSVDDRPVEGRSLAAVAADIRGRVGTPVRLAISRRGLFRRTTDITITREQIAAPAVLLKQGVAGSVIQILTFNADTARSVRDILKTHKAGRTLTLDLRGCPGGSLQAAIATSNLFLTRGKRIVSVERAKGTSHYNALSEASDHASPLVIQQDERSASATEVLIAALTTNGRAIAVGPRTRGKGTVQEVIPLRDGYGMIITTGRMLAPDGRAWNRRGLSPSRR